MESIIKQLRKTPKWNSSTMWGDMEYSGWMDENISWKKTCCLGDWSFKGHKGVLVEGPDALKLFQNLSVNSITKLEAHQARHLIMCNNGGKCIINGLLFNNGDGTYYWQHHEEWPQYNMIKGGYNCKMTPTELYGLQLAGPTSINVIEKLCGESIRDIEFMRFRYVTILNHRVMIVRQNMAGEVGYELEGPYEYHDEMIAALMEAGQEFGIRRLGWRSVFMNHLESGTAQTDYIPAIYGEDMREFLDWLIETRGEEFAYRFSISGSFESDKISDYYRSPYDLGWGRFVNFNHEFPGKDALRKESEGPNKKWVSLEWNSEDVIEVYASLIRGDEPHYDYMDLPKAFYEVVDLEKVMVGDILVGTASSRGFSYFFRKMISHCMIDENYSEPGTEVEVIWGQPGHRQKRIRAVVCPSPYKEDKRKFDVNQLPNYL